MFNELAQNFKSLTPSEQTLIFQLSKQNAKTFLKLFPGHPLLTHVLYNNGDTTDPVISAYNKWQSMKSGE
jgi:hypothetical protein